MFYIGDRVDMQMVFGLAIFAVWSFASLIESGRRRSEVGELTNI